jgi:hypothetical protein
MTEAEWLACTEPQNMLEALHARPVLSERKARLFAAACCRRVFPLVLDGRSWHAVTVCELYADGLTSQRALAAARAEAGEVARALEVAPVSLERNKALAAARATSFSAPSVFRSSCKRLSRSPPGPAAGGQEGGTAEVGRPQGGGAEEGGSQAGGAGCTGFIAAGEG